MLSDFPADLQTFLFLLASVPAGIFSQFEKWPWFAALTPSKKLIIQLVLSSVAAVITTVIAAGVIPAETLSKVNFVYVLIVQVITAIASNFGTHISVNVLAKPTGAALQAKATSINTSTVVTQSAQPTATVTPPADKPLTIVNPVPTTVVTVPTADILPGPNDVG